MKKVWKLKNPVYASLTGKKLQQKPTVEQGQTQSLIALHCPDRRSGGKKAEFLGAGGYTKNSNRKFYKKKLKAP
ncbi:hypothetical protein QUB61_25005 [Microcoleus sp. C2D2]